MTVVTGHQPAYLPWLGLIHKASLADVFVYMDDVQYLERDWNNRNKVKTPQGGEKWLTVPVDLKASPSRMLKDIVVSAQREMPEAKRWQAVHWQTLKSVYGGCRHFKEYAPFFEHHYLGRTWESLSELDLAILRQAFAWFGVSARVEVASLNGFTQKKSDLVLEHAERFHADVVVTGTFGKDYVKLEDFSARGIKVVFQEYKHPIYEQRFGAFAPYLSFVDLLFQHGSDSRRICLEGNLTREELCAARS
jgi:hypothetical protein